MTFGIDIASPQRDIDLGRAKAEGVQFVIVKMGGLNVTPQYVAPYYRAQVDRAIAAGLPKGHYYLIGGGQVWQSPTEQARFFAANLYRFDPDRDVLMLDNEGLDSNGYLFDDAESAEFLTELIRLKGIPANRVWHYAGAKDYRNLGPWPKTAALGVRFVWAAYGDYPTGKTPDHEPDLQGSIPRWDVHQFTSKSRVAGYELDGNYSPHSVATLFGGTMTLEDQMRQYIAANKKPYDAATWDQMCGSLMYRFNSWRGWVTMPSKDISSAYRAGMNSGWLNTNLSAAPVGAFHFFDIAGPGNGHVMQDARGGGLVCLSSGYALSESLGNAIGFQSVPGYVAAKGARYMGWATNYAGGTISTAGLAGGGYEEIDMPLDANDKAFLNGLGAAIIEQILGYGSGAGKSATVGDQVAKIRADLGTLHTESPYSLKKIFEAQASGGVDVDALAQKIAALVVIPPSSGVTEAQVEAAVRRVFADAAA